MILVSRSIQPAISLILPRAAPPPFHPTTAANLHSIITITTTHVQLPPSLISLNITRYEGCAVVFSAPLGCVGFASLHEGRVCFGGIAAKPPHGDAVGGSHRPKGVFGLGLDTSS
ncbi:hypothetical protein Tco_0922627, partial [Tanacetum coccineum]